MTQASRVPKLVAGVSDLRSLPLAPIDGFVLSRVNGAMTVRDIAVATGLGEDAVAQSLQKLVGLGVVDLGDGAPRPSVAPATPPVAPQALPPPRPSTPSPAVEERQRLMPQAGPKLSRDLPPRYDPREVDEACDLTPDERKRVLDLYYEIEDLDFYQLLGVPRTADKKAIKRAYFELAAHFHPDKFFRKELGSFKQKMEIIFGRVTEAHDTLTSKQARPDYDAYLEAQAQARGIEAMMSEARVEAERAHEDLQRGLQSGPPPSISVRPSAPPAASTGLSSAPPRQSSSPSLRAPAPADARDLRDALARRLTGLPPRAVTAPRAPMPAPQPPTTQDAMDALKRRYEDRRNEAALAQARKHRDSGDAARAKGDLVAAATAYRVATSFAPDDDDLRKVFIETQRAADELLAETYQKQALYEERNSHWAEAARSWARVCKGRSDDAKAHERLAHAHVQAQGNLHEAADAAKRAIELAPQTISFRVTLANVYVAAGLTIAAKRELEAAAKLEPGNAAVDALLKKLQKTG